MIQFSYLFILDLSGQTSSYRIEFTVIALIEGIEAEYNGPDLIIF